MGVKCKFFDECHSYATIIVPFNKIPLCKYHFLKYVKDRVWKTIKMHNLIDFNNPDEKVLIALSGGKDSQTLLHILHKILKGKVHYEGLFINVNISARNYSNLSLEAIRDLTDKYSIPLNIVDIKEELGFTMDDVHKLGQKMKADKRKRNSFRGECSYCGVIKRYYLNKFAYDHGFTKVATGHNLTDEATTLFSNFLNIDLEQMMRSGPITTLDVKKLVPRIKPLYYIYESEVLLYAYLSNIKHVSIECEYSIRSPMIKLKKSLLKIEDIRRSTMRNMVYEFQRGMKSLLLEHRSEEKQIEHYCKVCGMPTYVYSDTCSFCNTTNRLKTEMEKYGLINLDGMNQDTNNREDL